MSRAVSSAAVALLVVVLPVLGAAEEPSARDLSQEVNALQMLYQLQLTAPQLAALKELARDTADRSRPAGRTKASDKLRKALASYRDALVRASDPEKIVDLAEVLDDVQQAEKPTLHDEVDVTEEARAQAPAAFKLLTAPQLAAYAGIVADDVADPAEVLLGALARARKVQNAEWKKLRLEIAEEVGRLLAGVDYDRADELGNKAAQLLIIARGLSDAEFQKEKPDLEKKARALVGNVPATDVLRNVIELRLAELLSNPRLRPAIEARLK
jgi:hypothetical protein